MHFLQRLATPYPAHFPEAHHGARHDRRAKPIEEAGLKLHRGLFPGIRNGNLNSHTKHDEADGLTARWRGAFSAKDCFSRNGEDGITQIRKALGNDKGFPQADCT